MKILHLALLTFTLNACMNPAVQIKNKNTQTTDPSTVVPSRPAHDSIIPTTKKIPSLKNNEIYYFTSEDEYPIMDLFAQLNDSTYSLSKVIDGACISIKRVGDFNQNGFNDALIQVINGCGGNCCGDSFMFVTYDGDSFKGTQTVGYDWDGVEIDSTPNAFKIIVETKNEGANTDFPEHKTEICSLKGSKLEIIKTITPKKVIAQLDILSSELEKEGRETMQFNFDLNDDGETDLITCNFWERWGRMGVEIQFSNGEKQELNEMPKRFGILESKTNGIHDLVIDINEVLKWNGTSYDKVKN